MFDLIRDTFLHSTWREIIGDTLAVLCLPFICWLILMAGVAFGVP